MDSLTQIVLGASVGEAVLGKKVGNKALLWGAIAGTIPDLDVIFARGDAITEIVVHRGYSHSIVFAIAMAPLLGWLVHRLYQKRNEASQWEWTRLFFWSIFTHPLLDCLTTYGTQLFLPFSDYRVSIASVFVVDVFYTLPFLICVVAVLFVSRDRFRLRRRINQFGLILSTAYLTLGIINKFRATEVFEKSIAAQNQQMELRFVGTTPLNIVLWYGVAETDSAFYIGYHSFFSRSDVVVWIQYQKLQELLSEVKDECGIDRLKWFSDNLYVVRKGGQDTLNFYSLKFGRTNFTEESAEGSFSFYFRIVGTQNPVYESIRNTEGVQLKNSLWELKEKISGN